MTTPTTPTIATTTPGMMDPADEAGGEVIYSSDGLTPVPVTKPPTVSFGSKTNAAAATSTTAAAAGASNVDQEELDVVIESDSLSPQDAFEVFSGKVYSVKQPSSLLRRMTAPSSSSSSSTMETPLEKLARLQTEMNELESELRTTAANSGRDFDESLVLLATQLKTRMTAATQTRLAEQDELTRMIRSQLKHAKEAQGEEGGKGGSTDTTATTSPSTTGIVYELYGTASNPTTTLEERLIKLERLVGSSTTSQKSLLGRLEELETLVKHLDEKKLEQAQLKAKVIRADLEAASKARNKLTATYKKEDSKTIQELYQQMTELEGVSQYLPALTARLQQLATLHVQSASFATRLRQTEEHASHASAQLTQLEQTMDALRQGMVDNVQLVEKNLKSLDERLNKL